MATSTKKLKQAKELTELLLYTQQQVPSFSPQCFLLEKAGQIQRSIEQGGMSVSEPGGKGGKLPVRQLGVNLNTPGSGEPSNLKYVQHITSLQRSNYESYFKFNPSDIAQMAHFMSVTEALTSKKGRTTERAIMNTERNLKDITSFGSNTILQKNAKRHGAGIESINADFVGVDSFTKKQVSLTAKFFFQDIKTMLSDPYAALFKLETSRGTKGNEKFRTIDFHIGWNSNNSKIKKQIKNLKLTIRTHLVKYSFDVRQDGSIIVDAVYRGYYLEGFSGPQANILELAKTRYLEIKQRQGEIAQRAARIKTRNRRNVGDFELRNFVLDRTLATVDKNFKKLTARTGSGASRGRIGLGGAGSTPTTGLFLKGADVTAFVNNIKNETLTKIISEIIADSGKQKLFLTSSELKLPEAKRGSKITAKVRATDGDISKIIDSVLNLGADLDTPDNYVGAGKSKALWDDISALIQKQKDANKKSLTTSKSNIKDATRTAFDEQARLASLGRLKALQIISEKLVSSGDIKYAKIPRDVVRNFKLGAASASKMNIDSALNRGRMANPTSYITDKLKISENNFNNESFQVVPFVFLGNLIENMLNVPARFKETSKGAVPDSMFTVYNLMKQAGSDVKIDLGLVSYNAPYTGNRIVNLKLYYMPISLTELNNFFARIVLSKGKTFYSFNEFLDDLLKKFLTGIFSSCSKESNSKGLGAPKVETTIGDLPEKRKRTTQYFIHGAKDTINDLLKSGITPATFGKYNANLRASIPHFFVFGRSAGIEKNVKLTDIADDQLKTAVYYSPRSSLINDIKGNEQLKRTGFIPAVFQTEIETIGFPIMNLGQLIYVDLKPTIDKNLAKSRPFDASGYYGVHKVSHTISKNNFSTNISAILQISDRDSSIVREGGLGNLTGKKEGGRARFFTTESGRSESTAWSTSGESAAPATPTTAKKTTPSKGVAKLAETTSGVKKLVDDKGYLAEKAVKSFILTVSEGARGMGVVAGSAFYSSEYTRFVEKNVGKVTDMDNDLWFEAAIAFEDATEVGADPGRNVIRERTYQNFRYSGATFGYAGFGIIPAGGVIPGMDYGSVKDASGKSVFPIDDMSKAFSAAAGAKIKEIYNSLSAEDKKKIFGRIVPLGDYSYWTIFREYDDGEVSIQLVKGP